MFNAVQAKRQLHQALKGLRTQCNIRLVRSVNLVRSSCVAAVLHLARKQGRHVCSSALSRHRACQCQIVRPLCGEYLQLRTALRNCL